MRRHLAYRRVRFFFDIVQAALGLQEPSPKLFDIIDVDLGLGLGNRSTFVGAPMKPGVILGISLGLVFGMSGPKARWQRRIETMTCAKNVVTGRTSSTSVLMGISFLKKGTTHERRKRGGGSEAQRVGRSVGLKTPRDSSSRFISSYIFANSSSF